VTLRRSVASFFCPSLPGPADQALPTGCDRCLPPVLVHQSTCLCDQCPSADRRLRRGTIHRPTGAGRGRHPGERGSRATLRRVAASHRVSSGGFTTRPPREDTLSVHGNENHSGRGDGDGTHCAAAALPRARLRRAPDLDRDSSTSAGDAHWHPCRTRTPGGGRGASVLPSPHRADRGLLQPPLCCLGDAPSLGWISGQSRPQRKGRARVERRKGADARTRCVARRRLCGRAKSLRPAGCHPVPAPASRAAGRGFGRSECRW